MMFGMNKRHEHLDRACAALGGQAALGSAVGVKQPTVNGWVTGDQRVPAERCPRIEAATRAVAASRGDPALIVTCEQLRPDVGWDVLRMQAAPVEQDA